MALLARSARITADVRDAGLGSQRGTKSISEYRCSIEVGDGKAGSIDHHDRVMPAGSKSHTGRDPPGSLVKQEEGIAGSVKGRAAYAQRVPLIEGTCAADLDERSLQGSRPQVDPCFHRDIRRAKPERGSNVVFRVRRRYKTQSAANLTGGLGG